MAPSLSRYVNKTILVSIPPISGDIKCRPYKLTGIELIGLWLEGADLARDFLALEQSPHSPTTWTFFIPYSQIACVAVGTTPALIPGGGTAPAAQSQVMAPGAQASVVVKPPTSSTSSQKKPKNKER